MTGRPALFLDRDGVVNVDRAYVYRQEDVEFIDGIFDLCRHAKQLGYLIFIITNQAGIGRGYYTEQDFSDLMSWMCGIFANENAAIDKVYFCPTHPEHAIGEYKTESYFRKPAPGMIFLAAKEFNVNLRNSIFLGDKPSDLEAGIAAGVGNNILYYPDKRDSESTPGSVVSHPKQVLAYLKRWNC